jgi:hypothetical protein
MNEAELINATRQLRKIVDELQSMITALNEWCKNLVAEKKAFAKEKKILAEAKKNLFAGYPKDGEFIEYFRIWPETTGLPLNIFADCTKSYRRRKHPLWIYVQRNIDIPHEGAFILTVEPQPRMLGKLSVTLTPQQINDVKRVISKNMQLFVDIANMKIEYEEFYDKFIPLNQIRLSESKNGHLLICEMSNLLKRYTGLPVNLWIDDGGTYMNSGHAERLKFQNNTKDNITPNDLIPISVHDDFNVYASEKEIKVKKWVIDYVRKWISYNRDDLIDVMNGKKPFKTFTNTLVRIDARGLPVQSTPSTENDNNSNNNLS